MSDFAWLCVLGIVIVVAVNIPHAIEAWAKHRYYHESEDKK